MIVDTKKLDKALNQLKVNKKNLEMMKNGIENHLFLYKKLNIDPSDSSLILVTRKSENVEVIRVFGHNNIPIEILDNSYGISKKVITSKSEILGIYWVSFFDEGKTVSIVKSKLSDMGDLSYKKVKNVSYGITNGTEVIQLSISQQDIKGIEPEQLKNAVAYMFTKKTGKSSKDLNCMVISYS